MVRQGFECRVPWFLGINPLPRWGTLNQVWFCEGGKPGESGEAKALAVGAKPFILRRYENYYDMVHQSFATDRKRLSKGTDKE
jgi:hypothetical protein